MKRISNRNFTTELLFLSISAHLFVFSNASFAQPESSIPEMYNTYVLDNIPIAKTPKYLGLNVEVMAYVDESNIWDWLMDSNTRMVRAPHPATLFRKKGDEINRIYAQVKNKQDFDNFRKNILKNPDTAINWKHYLYSEDLPWLGKMDDIATRLNNLRIESIMAMCYFPSLYPESILTQSTELVPVPDDLINWAAASSAYEYYFACMYRYTKKGCRYFMMRNEPPLDDVRMMQEFGVLARMARMALDDIKNDEKQATIQLLGPAVYMGYEEYLHYNKNYVDILDVHHYDTNGATLRKKLRRGLMRARENNLKYSLTEFGRIGGATDIEESLFAIQPSLQVADLIMNVLSASGVNDPLFEMALFYQFQFPATHRNYKSLVYGDMNLIDWTGMDEALQNRFNNRPGFEQLQLRFPTPAYHIFKMLARCTPGNQSDMAYYKVYELMEAHRGVTATREKRTKRNTWPDLGENRYYANDGLPYHIKSLVVETENRLYVNILNQEPVALNAMKIDVSSLKNIYTSAVIRETSLIKRDEPVAMQQVKNGTINFDIPAESFLQIIFVKEDLNAISELKTEEQTFTPGNVDHLKLLETTRLKTFGKYQGEWIDISDLHVQYSTEIKSGIKVYSNGLIQRMVECRNVDSKVTVRTMNDGLSVEVVVD